MTRNILVIRVSDRPDVDALTRFRDYARASLKLGVLVLPDDAELSLLNRVGLDDVEMTGDDELVLPPPSEPEVPPRPEPVPDPNPETAPAFSGPGATDKRRIYNKLREYRAANGLGCWGPVAEAVGESTDWVRSVYAGEVTVPLGMWRKIGKALDELTFRNRPISNATQR